MPAQTPGTVIAANTTVDALFTALFGNRSGTQGTIAYSWNTPNTIMGKYADGSCVIAKLEARPFTPTVITL